MAIIYNIQKELLDLFGEIEANGGEVTEEQIELLNIKESELQEKLDNYYKAIQSWKADMATCKEEEKRIADTRKKYENRIDRLKTIMLDSVNTFGTEGKTNKFIELPTVRIFTKNTKAIQLNEERINLLIYYMTSFINEAYSNGCLYTGNDVDFAGILQAINANAIAEQGQDFKSFTIEDLSILTVDVIYNGNFINMFINNNKMLETIGEMYLNTSIKQNTTKEAFKLAIDVKGQDKITIAELVNNQTLQIK